MRQATVLEREWALKMAIHEEREYIRNLRSKEWLMVFEVTAYAKLSAMEITLALMLDAANVGDW